MALHFFYSNPTTPAGPGWTEDLGTDTVRLGSISGLTTEAELGAVGTCSLLIDDPLAEVGHDADAIVGLKQFRITEDTAPVDHQTIWIGYVGDRTYRRGSGGESESLIQGPARLIDCTLVDLNTFLTFRVFQPESLDATSSFNRPAETDIVRVQALLAVDFLSTTLFDLGLVEDSLGVAMDAVDYTGQRPADVLNDCSQQSGRNFFVYFDEGSDQYGLFYHRNVDDVFPTDMRISNVPDDIEGSLEIPTGPTWPPLRDAELQRDPSRVIAGGLSTSPAAYENNLTTSYNFGYRDAIIDSGNLKTASKASTRIIRYLAENETEDDRITVTVKLPAANVNDWMQGQLGSVRFQHLPGYEDFRTVRCIQRTVMQTEETELYYDVRFELTPVEIVSSPSGATSAQMVGVSYSGIPELPRETTPGNILLAIMFAAGNTTRFPFEFRALDNPPVSPVSPASPPFSAIQTAAWTVIATSVTDYSGQNIGGPCGQPYGGPHGGTWSGAPYQCTSGLFLAAAWRYVAPAEVTTQPAQFSTEITDSQTLTFLWELPTTTPPDGTYVELDGDGGGNPSTATLPTISGNCIAAFNWALSAGHGGVVQPLASALLGDGETLRGPIKTIPGSHAPVEMNDTTINSNVQNWGWLVALPEGGIPSVQITANAAYAHVNWCGLAIRLPDGIELPDIPYPANQSA